MKTWIPSKYFCFFGLIVLLLSSCIPDKLKEQINQNMDAAQTMVADQEFKLTIAHIELHKLRNGDYPESLNELQFLSAFDSSALTHVVYHKLDSGYELNINYKIMSLTGQADSEVSLEYPAEFWNGLGCVSSNAK